jgi:hypothetical protein
MNISKIIVLSVAAISGLTAALGDGGGGSLPCCLSCGNSGIPKFLGQYDGCTACTSDNIHGDGVCGTIAGQGQAGTTCYLGNVPDTYYTRSPGGIPCVCHQTKHDYTYKDPVCGGPCVGAEPGSPQP